MRVPPCRQHDTFDTECPSRAKDGVLTAQTGPPYHFFPIFVVVEIRGLCNCKMVETRVTHVPPPPPPPTITPTSAIHGWTFPRYDLSEIWLHPHFFRFPPPQNATLRNFGSAEQRRSRFCNGKHGGVILRPRHWNVKHCNCTVVLREHITHLLHPEIE